MKSRKSIIRSYLLYCGLKREEFEDIREQIALRNDRSLRVTSIFVTLFGAIFLLINLLSGSAVIYPYFILICGGAIIAAVRHVRGHPEKFTCIRCYAMLLVVFAYAAILSVQPSNRDVPATSFIVFVALLPLSVDDRPIRMISVMLVSMTVYLCLSRFLKSPAAFRLDVLNGAAFLVTGVVFYFIICSRNVWDTYQSEKVERLQKGTISSLAMVIEERDESTGDHILRTEDYVKRLTEGMKRTDAFRGMDGEYFENVCRAAPMHDIGKIKIPDGILNKPGRLTEEEFDLMKKHSVYGAEIIRRTMDHAEEDEYYHIAYNIALYHHERYDGGGYPEGLKGEDIPLEARIMALADVYDALVSDRVYKKAYPREKARLIIREGRGTQFDPALTDIFLTCVE